MPLATRMRMGGTSITTISNVQAASTTLTSRSFGTEASDRWIVVAWACRENSDATTITIGGVSGTIVQDRNASASSDMVVGLAYAQPTGTSGDIVINGLSNAKMVSVFRVIKSRRGVISTYNAEAATVSGVSIPVGGGLVAVSSNIIESTARTWSNATEQDDTSFSSGGQSSRFCSASRSYTDGVLSSASVGVDGGTYPVCCAVVFG